MEKEKKLFYLDKIANWFELAIAFLLLIIIGIKIFEFISGLLGFNISVLAMEFDQILSNALTLVIGIEFVRMLFKQMPATVIDVLLFAIARQIIIYHEGTLQMAAGIAAIAGLFAIKKYLADKSNGIAH